MKNIHVIPTDKSSILWINNCKNQNIYITSDKEINVNDYITDGYLVWKWKDDSSLLGRKKVILTTDQYLIKDGVQAIEEEFLEWFVNNPSCEFVKIKFNEFEVDMGLGNSCIEFGSYYKIIIPKEETFKYKLNH